MKNKNRSEEQRQLMCDIQWERYAVGLVMEDPEYTTSTSEGRDRLREQRHAFYAGWNAVATAIGMFVPNTVPYKEAGLAALREVRAVFDSPSGECNKE